MKKNLACFVFQFVFSFSAFGMPMPIVTNQILGFGKPYFITDESNSYSKIGEDVTFFHGPDLNFNSVNEIFAISRSCGSSCYVGLSIRDGLTKKLMLDMYVMDKALDGIIFTNIVNSGFLDLVVVPHEVERKFFLSRIVSNSVIEYLPEDRYYVKKSLMPDFRKLKYLRNFGTGERFTYGSNFISIFYYSNDSIYSELTYLPSLVRCQLKWNSVVMRPDLMKFSTSSIDSITDTRIAVFYGNALGQDMISVFDTNAVVTNKVLALPSYFDRPDSPIIRVLSKNLFLLKGEQAKVLGWNRWISLFDFDTDKINMLYFATDNFYDITTSYLVSNKIFLRRDGICFDLIKNRKETICDEMYDRSYKYFIDSCNASAWIVSNKVYVPY